MRKRTHSPVAAMILLLVLGLPATASTTLAPAEPVALAFRERETLRWATGAGTEVEGNVQITSVGGGGAPITFKLDNQGSVPLGGGVLFSCASSGGTYQVSLSYRNLGGSGLSVQAGLRLTCLPPFNLLQMRANGLARRVEFQDGTQVTRAISVPLEPTFRIRLDNLTNRGGIEALCESPFEGRIDFGYRYRDPDSATVIGTMPVVCYQF